MYVEVGHPLYPHPEHSDRFETPREYALYMGTSKMYGTDLEILGAAILFRKRINLVWCLPNNVRTIK